jgi:hypothetical protein
MDFQTFINSVDIILISALIIAFVVAGFLISSETYMATVSWNG